MNARRKRLCADLQTLARRSLLIDRGASAVLTLLSSAVELDETDSLAQAALNHGTSRLRDLRAELDAALADLTDLTRFPLHN